MKIPKVDQDYCLSCGNCEAVCPEVFHLKEDTGKWEVINPQGPPEDGIRMP